ncbi:MAG: RNA polymerase sigma factor [Elusimicrobia bacterium]|nr:RNA polymerase sigma factor [Elusimicrobiota bacterium]
MQQEDIRMVTETLKGDSEAFKPLVEKYQNRLYDLALRMTGNIHEAEDIAQTAFIKAYASLKLYNTAHDFSNWLYTIALNITRNRLRRLSIINFFSLERFGFPEGENAPPEPVDAHDKPEESLTKKELLKCLDKAVRNLPVSLKEVFVLFHFHETSLNDISIRLGISQNAVSLRLLKGRKLLYKQLAPKFPEYFKNGTHDKKEADYVKR